MNPFIYLSPDMLISRKASKDKRVITKFRHLNMRIAKNNLAYPLLKDTFSVLGGSRCCCSIALCVRNFHNHQLHYTVVFRNPSSNKQRYSLESVLLYYSIGNLHLSLLVVQLHFSVYIGSVWMCVYEWYKVEGLELEFLDYLSFT